ncbi:BnaA03g54270D [Brassica napus]|uniref:BnaA03g54270D protein n=1 Tax=Brassica napus TaxID=3708 RepID=A0A078GWM9_BRANA|nr:BnaA03g54270D [Brassica napus]
MAKSYTLLDNLRAGRPSVEVLGSEKHQQRGGLMSVETLLIDEHSTVVQGSISAIRQLTLTDGPVSICFNDGTAFEKLATTVRIIPTEHFRFRPYEQLIELANTGKQLPDVMGELRAIRSTITDHIPGAQRVMLTLRLESDVNVCVSLQELFLSQASILKILPDVGTEQSGSSSKVVHAQKIELLTVAELTQFVISGDPQIIEFLCTAKVTEIQQSEGWCYIGCAVCSKKLIREESSFTCAPCNVTNAVAKLRYRVVLSVSDNTGSAAFVGFDTEVAKLTNVLASEAAQIVGIGINAQVDTDLPQALAGIVGNTYTFQLRLTDFNFTANHQTFTISRIFPARELAPLPTFEEGVDVHEPAVPQTVAPVSDPINEITINVADQATTSEGSLAVRREAAEGKTDLEESAPKKARVE